MAIERITADTVGNVEDFNLIVTQKGGFYLRATRLRDGDLCIWKPGENVWEAVQTLSSLVTELELQVEEQTI
jgi:hypothetical protein